MKTCEEYRELIGAYVDRELGRMERMEVEAHAEQCPECAKYLELNKKLFSEQLFEMPVCVSEKVMERVKASATIDMFTGEESMGKEQVEIEMRRKLRKREGIKSWTVVAVMLVFVFGYYLLQNWVLGKKTVESAPAPESATEETVEDVKLENNASAGEQTVGDNEQVVVAFRDSLAKADTVTIKFGANKIVLFEGFKKEYIADYIASNPCKQLEGRVEYKSVGSIKTDPENKMNIQITDTHKIIFSYNSAIYEFATEREALLYALQGVGMLG